MNNPTDNDRIQEASKKLLELKQRVDEVRALAPDWMDIGSVDQYPKGKREDVFDLLLSISFYDGLKDLVRSLPSIISVENKEIFEWYKSNSDVVDKAFELVIEKIAADKYGPTAPVSDKHAPAVCDQSIKTAFAGIMAFMRDYLNNDKDRAEQLVHEGGLNVGACEKIMKMPYFQPDAWVKNARYPVTVMQDLGEIPLLVRERVDEIRYSFVFGNWLAVIALSRSLLEYAILDKQCTKKNRAPHGLGYLINCVGKKDPGLAELMSCIKEAGDRVMHRKDAKAGEHLLRKDVAEKCFENIAEIIGTLYSAEYRPK